MPLVPVEKLWTAAITVPRWKTCFCRPDARVRCRSLSADELALPADAWVRLAATRWFDPFPLST